MKIKFTGKLNIEKLALHMIEHYKNNKALYK